MTVDCDCAVLFALVTTRHPFDHLPWTTIGFWDSSGVADVGRILSLLLYSSIPTPTLSMIHTPSNCNVLR